MLDQSLTTSPEVSHVTPHALCFWNSPEAIKMAPLVLAAQRNPKVTPIVCLTGQHREMLDQVVKYFGLRVDHDLNLMQPNQTLSILRPDVCKC